MEDKITTIRVSEGTINKLKECKKYPRETNEETLIRLIKEELK